MAKVNTKWTTHPRFNLSDAIGWYPSDGSDSGGNLYDFSGNARDLTTGGTAPTLATGLTGIGGGQAHYFNGTTTSPLTMTEALIWKHVFAVVSYEDATFPDYSGAVSGTQNVDNPILIGNSGDTDFFDTAISASYRKSDVVRPIADADAPMSGEFAVVEISVTAGSAISGISVGQDRQFAGRLWKGHVAEVMIFDAIQPFSNRRRIYEYFAMKYQLWRYTDSTYSTAVFPFLNDKATPFKAENYAIVSPPLPNGVVKARVKGLRRKAYQMDFTQRRQEELDAVEAFEKAHYPVTIFAVDNNAYYPTRRINVRFNEPINYRSEIVSRYTYQLSVTQSDETETEISET